MFYQKTLAHFFANPSQQVHQFSVKRYVGVWRGKIYGDIIIAWCNTCFCLHNCCCIGLRLFLRRWKNHPHQLYFDLFVLNFLMVSLWVYVPEWQVYVLLISLQFLWTCHTKDYKTLVKYADIILFHKYHSCVFLLAACNTTVRASPSFSLLLPFLCFH